MFWNKQIARALKEVFDYMERRGVQTVYGLPTSANFFTGIAQAYYESPEQHYPT